MKKRDFWGNLWGNLKPILRRLEFLGLYSYLKVQSIIGRRSGTFDDNDNNKLHLSRIRTLRLSAYLSSMILFFLTIATIIPIYTKSNQAEATTGTATASTLTFTSTSSTASVSLNVNSADGTFATSSDGSGINGNSNIDERASFSISTNNYTGYTLTLKSAGNVANTDLNNSGTTISTLSASTDATTFAANTAAGKALNNKWGIIPSYYNSVANTTNYYPAPANSNGITLRATESANSANGINNADTYTIGLGLRVDYANPSGAYENSTFVMQYVANPITSTITYNKNTTDSVSNMPAINPQPYEIIGGASSENSLVELSDALPTRNGYFFKGWCATTTNVTNGQDYCSGKIYQPGDSFGIDQTANTEIVLYAVWLDRNLLVISYDANTKGANYGGADNTVNNVYYNATSTPAGTVTKYSHTPNINDAGEQNGGYPGRFFQNDVVTIPGADSLHVVLNYDLNNKGNGWSDELIGWGGNHPHYTFDDWEVADIYDPQYGLFSGGNGTREYDIDDSSVTFAFQTRHISGSDYGYYAIVTGDGYNYAKTNIAGSYQAPTLPSGYYFLGWSEDPNATYATYANESEVAANLDAINGDTVVLYAVYKNTSTVMIGVEFLDHVDVIEDNETLCTVSDGMSILQSCELVIGETYTLSATLWEFGYYHFDSWSKSGAGTMASTSMATTTFIPGVGGTTILAVGAPDPVNVTVNFDSGISSVTFIDDSYDPGATYTVSTSGGSVALANNESYYIEVSYAPPYGHYSMPGGGMSGCGVFPMDNIDEPTCYVDYYLDEGLPVWYGFSAWEDATLDFTSMVTDIIFDVIFEDNNIEKVVFEDGYHHMQTITTSGTVLMDGINGGVLGWTVFARDDYRPIAHEYCWPKRDLTYNTEGSQQVSGGDINYSKYTGSTSSPGCTIRVSGVRNSVPYMQNGDAIAAAVPNTGDITTAIDARDGTLYRVARLADDNIWMLDNLALDLTSVVLKYAMRRNSSDTKTNASYASINKLFNGGGTTSDKYPTAKLNNVAWTSSSQNYYSIPMMVKSGTCNNDYCVNSPSSGNWSYDAVTTATINGITSRVQGKIGIYYNYCAASAGSYCYGNNTSAGTSSGNATEDICPAGWHMPSGDTAKGSYYYLYNTSYSASYNDFVDALSTPLSGLFYSGKAHFQGNYGYFWSSTRYGNNSMYGLDVSSSYVNPQYYDARDNGNPVRCIMGS